MKREDLGKWIVIINNKGELTEILSMLEIEAIPTVENYPLIIYQGQNKSIELSEIEKVALSKLQKEKLESKVVWDFSNIKSGLAKSMESSA